MDRHNPLTHGFIEAYGDGPNHAEKRVKLALRERKIANFGVTTRRRAFRQFFL